MDASVDISLYPLTEDYKEQIFGFIEKIKKEEGLLVEVNGMSTQIFGNYKRIMQVLTNEMGEFFEDKDNKGMFIIKVGQGTLRR